MIPSCKQYWKDMYKRDAKYEITLSRIWLLKQSIIIDI